MPQDFLIVSLRYEKKGIENDTSDFDPATGRTGGVID